MEDARYRARHITGLEFADSEVNLVSGSPGDVLHTYIVKHQAIELCVFGIDTNAGILTVAAGDEATLGLYKLPREGAAAEVALGVELAIPAAGIPARGGYAVDCNIETNINNPNDRPILYRGDRLRIKLVDNGATTAQAGRPWVQFREFKKGIGPQEGPS